MCMWMGRISDFSPEELEAIQRRQANQDRNVTPRPYKSKNRSRSSWTSAEIELLR